MTVMKTFRYRIYPAELDRDFNASRNILEQGLKIQNPVSGTDSESKQKREEASPLGESASHETQGSLALG